jgi:hypothetical protein
VGNDTFAMVARAQFSQNLVHVILQMTGSKETSDGGIYKKLRTRPSITSKDGTAFRLNKDL